MPPPAQVRPRLQLNLTAPFHVFLQHKALSDRRLDDAIPNRWASCRDARQPVQCELFSQGLAAYRRQDWDEAETHFKSCLSIAAEDATQESDAFKKVARWSAPPPADWDGIWRPSDK
jgi:hypothetical protein